VRRRNEPCVILVCEDVDCLLIVATELAAAGCEVFCVRDVRQAADLVRAGFTMRFVLVLIGEELVPPAHLRAAMAAHLPEWKIECDELGDVTGSTITEARFLN